MDQKLKSLLNLNTIYSEKSTLEKEIKDIPQQIEDLKAEQVRQQAGYDAAHQAYLNLEVAQNRDELLVKTNEELIAKKNNQLMQVKTNVAYGALVKEIDTLKRKNRELEDRILGYMEKIEIAQSEAAEVLQGVETAGQGTDQKIKDLEAVVAEAMAKIDGVGDRLAEAEGPVDRKYLSIFYNIARKKTFTNIMVPVIDDACGGCRLNIPGHIQQKVDHGVSLVNCDACGRLLFASDEEPDAESEPEADSATQG